MTEGEKLARINTTVGWMNWFNKLTQQAGHFIPFAGEKTFSSLVEGSKSTKNYDNIERRREKKQEITCK